MTGLTAGLGIRVAKNTMLDYAYLPYGELGASQRLSLTFKFSCPETGKAAQVQPEPKPKAEVKPAPVVEPKLAVLENMVVLEDTHFEFDSSTLTKEGKKIVLENTQVLRDNPKARVRIAGYASASGTEEYNQKLSERRAKAVKEMLVKEGGIPEARMTTIGYGETRPAKFESTPKDIDSKAAKANMRVLFEIIVK
jgi:outer membrane protein OmpA-like peptidoglycan-associated protein